MRKLRKYCQLLSKQQHNFGSCQLIVKRINNICSDVYVSSKCYKYLQHLHSPDDRKHT